MNNDPKDATVDLNKLAASYVSSTRALNEYTSMQNLKKFAKPQVFKQPIKTAVNISSTAPGEHIDIHKK